MKPNLQEKPTRALNGLDAQGDETKRVEAERQALRRAYAQLFSGEVGSRVLDDLLRRYGWRDGVELSSYRVGMPHADMAFVEGQKEVVRYVLTNLGGLTKQPKEG